MRTDLGRLADLVDESSPDDAGAAWAAGLVTRLTAAADAAAERAGAARTAYEVADRAAATAVAVADRQRRRAAARAALDRVEAERPGVDAIRTRITEAVRVLPVMPAIEAGDRARSVLALAERAVEAGRGALGDDAQDPGAAAAEVDGLLGVLAERLRDEVAALPRLRAGLVRAEAARSDGDGRLAALLGRFTTPPRGSRCRSGARGRRRWPPVPLLRAPC